MLICRTANYKLHALRRIRKYLTLEKTKLQYSAFINSQFNHVSVIWISCCKKDYLKIEKIQYKALKFIYNSSESYVEPLTWSNKVSIYQKYLRPLATEIYKSLVDIDPDFMRPYFKTKQMPRNLRNGHALKLPSTNSTYYGINSVLFRACLLWNQLPLSIKQSQSLLEFKSKMKTLRNIVCTCTICRTWFRNYVLWTDIIVIVIYIILQGCFLLAWDI